MNCLNSALATVVFAALFTLPNLCFAELTAAEKLVLEAKEALDAHYGRPEQLTRAAALLNRAFAAKQDDASIYVQAARLTIKGGYLVGLKVRPGTLEAYEELIDRALSRDPRNETALILKAEVFFFRGDRDSERAALEKAAATGTKDPWLLVSYGRLYEGLGEWRQAYRSYSAVETPGPGAGLDHRNAFVEAQNGLAGIFAGSPGNDEVLRWTISSIRKHRDPRDAWALGNLAGSLVWAGMYDEAIELSREALRIMNYGAARLTLTAALVGKAAELTITGKRDAAAPLLTEARSYGYAKSVIYQKLNLRSERFAPLAQAVESAFE
jgi:tetratricopeptide (TPR) repeat protein